MSDMTTAERQRLLKIRDELERVSRRIAQQPIPGVVRVLAHLFAYIVERDDLFVPRVRCPICSHTEHGIWKGRKCMRWMWEGGKPVTDGCSANYEEMT